MIAVVALALTITFLYFELEPISKLTFSNSAMLLVTLGLLIFAAMQYFLHKDSVKQQEYHHKNLVKLEEDRQNFDKYIESVKHKLTLFEARASFFALSVEIIVQAKLEERHSEECLSKLSLEKLSNLNGELHDHLLKNSYYLPFDVKTYVQEICSKSLDLLRNVTLIKKCEYMRDIGTPEQNWKTDEYLTAIKNLLEIKKWMKLQFDNNNLHEHFHPILILPNDI